MPTQSAPSPTSTKHPPDQRQQDEADQPGDKDRPVAPLGKDDLRPARLVGIDADGLFGAAVGSGHEGSPYPGNGWRAGEGSRSET